MLKIILLILMPINAQSAINELNNVFKCAHDVFETSGGRLHIGENRIRLYQPEIEALQPLVCRSITKPHPYLELQTQPLRVPNTPGGAYRYLDFMHVYGLDYTVGIDSALSGLLKIAIMRLEQKTGHWTIESTNLSCSINIKDEATAIHTTDTATITPVDSLGQIRDLGTQVCVLLRQNL